MQTRQLSKSSSTPVRGSSLETKPKKIYSQKRNNSAKASSPTLSADKINAKPVKIFQKRDAKPKSPAIKKKVIRAVDINDSIKHSKVFANTDYQNWIKVSSKGNARCTCKWCNKEFLIKNITGVNGHLQTSDHIEQKQKRLGNVSSISAEISTSIDSIVSKTNKFELDLIEFLVKHDEPLSRGQEFLGFLKNCFIDVDVIQQAKLSRRKATNNLVMAAKPMILSQLIENMKKIPLSIILDTPPDKQKSNI